MHNRSVARFRLAAFALPAVAIVGLALSFAHTGGAAAQEQQHCVGYAEARLDTRVYEQVFGYDPYGHIICVGVERDTNPDPGQYEASVNVLCPHITGLQVNVNDDGTFSRTAPDPYNPDYGRTVQGKFYETDSGERRVSGKFTAYYGEGAGPNCDLAFDAPCTKNCSDIQPEPEPEPPEEEDGEPPAASSTLVRVEGSVLTVIGATRADAVRVRFYPDPGHRMGPHYYVTNSQVDGDRFARLRVGPGCSRLSPGVHRAIYCPRKGITSIRFVLKGGSDHGDASSIEGSRFYECDRTWPVPVPQTFDGGDGNDVLGGASAYLKDRGCDQPETKPGRSIMRGGPGHDFLAKVNDGTNDVLEGGPGRDFLQAAGGNDRLVGGAGRDTIRGGRGGDRVFVRDGVRDVVRCGGGWDTVEADPVDQLHGCEKRL